MRDRDMPAVARSTVPEEGPQQTQEAAARAPQEEGELAMPDIIEFGVMDVIEEPDGVTFSFADGDDIFCTQQEARELLKFLSGLVCRWDMEWN